VQENEIYFVCRSDLCIFIGQKIQNCPSFWDAAPRLWVFGAPITQQQCFASQVNKILEKQFLFFCA
jgi:hypothetical protein